MKKISLAVIPVMLLLFAAAPKAKMLDALNIEGLVTITEESVLNTIELKEGKTFTPSDVQESIRRLYKTGNFRTVDFFIDEESEESVKLLLRLEEFPVVDKV